MGAGLDAVTPIRPPLVCEPAGVDEPGLVDKAGVRSANIESTATPPAPAPEASCWPELSPEQEMAAARDNARNAVGQFRDAEAHLSVCHLPGEGEDQISWWEQQVAILRPGAEIAADRYYALANEALEKAKPGARAADKEWDRAVRAGDQQKLDALSYARTKYISAETDIVEAVRLQEAGETSNAMEHEFTR
jgi:hypothetical protein